RTKSKVEKDNKGEMFESLVARRVEGFCITHNVNDCYKTIIGYATDRMKQDERISWESAVLRNPYTLMKHKGVGFVRADKLAMKLGFPVDGKQRILAFVGKALDDSSKGSTILEMGGTLSYISEKLGINDSRKVLDAVLNHGDGTYNLLDDGYKRTKDIMSSVYITKALWVETESSFYKLLKKLEKEEKFLPSVKVVDSVKSGFGYKLNDGQDSAIDDILKNNVNVLTGLGGTGKSTITKAILKILEMHGESFTCLAPTGIASKNFVKLTGFNCETIHRRAFSQSNEIYSDWLILEEASMLSVDHMDMLLNMIGHNLPKLLFIGDLNQLTPISPSAPFRDLFSLIKSKKVNGTIIELTEIMRASNESFIPHLCKMFTKYGLYNSSVEKSNHAGVSFYPIEKDLTKQVLGIVKDKGFDFQNTYVLSPQNVGEYGCGLLNKNINEAMANKRVLIRDKYREYRVGSELLHKDNNRSMDIYNGERITLLDKEYRDGDAVYVCKRLDEGTLIEYDEYTLLNQTQLSYGLTVHKTQSITAENVIMIVSQAHHYMNTKNLVYTGLSRCAKNLCIIYEDGALESASKKTEIDKRITFLGELAKR
ncbi:MAG: AAA family ATPase, partial [Cetobacterium sp.]